MSYGLKNTALPIYQLPIYGLPNYKLSDPATSTPVVKPDLSAWSVWWPLEAGTGSTFNNAGAAGTAAAYNGTFNHRTGGSGLPLWDTDVDIGGVVVNFGSPDPVTNAINAGSNLVHGAGQVNFAALVKYDDLETSSNIFASYDNDGGPASSRTGMRIYINASTTLTVITGYSATAPNSASISVPLIDAGIELGVPFLVNWKKYSSTYERLYVNGVFVAENTYSPLPTSLGTVATLKSSLGHYAFDTSATATESQGWRGPIAWMGLDLSSESTVVAADAAALALYQSIGL